MSSDVLEHLKKKFNEDIRGVEQAMSMGRMNSFEEYKHASGCIRGLQLAVRHIDDLLQNYEEYEDE